MAAVPLLVVHLLPVTVPSAAGFGPFLINFGKFGSCREEPMGGGMHGKRGRAPMSPTNSSELNPPTSHQRLPWARALAEGQQLLPGAAVGAAGASRTGGGHTGGAVAIEAPREVGWKRAGRGERTRGAPPVSGVPMLGRGSPRSALTEGCPGGTAPAGAPAQGHEGADELAPAQPQRRLLGGTGGGCQHREGCQHPAAHGARRHGPTVGWDGGGCAHGTAAYIPSHGPEPGTCVGQPSAARHGTARHGLFLGLSTPPGPELPPPRVITDLAAAASWCWERSRERRDLGAVLARDVHPQWRADTPSPAPHPP